MSCIAVYPGTFDPIHYGHIDIALRAAELFDKVVLGIYDKPTKTLLFSTEERLALAREAMADNPRIEVVPYSGLTVDFARQIGATVLVRGLRVTADFELEYQMALTNRQLAPGIESVCLMTHQDHAFLSSSIVKEVALLRGDVSRMVPPHVAVALEVRRGLRETKHEPVPLYSLRD